jgi:hypothetical protein
VGEASKVVDAYLLSNRLDNKFSPTVGERIGDQQVRIEDFEVIPNPPRTGMPVEFLFTILRQHATRGDLSVDLAVSILTEQGIPLFQLYSRHMGKDIMIPQGCSRIAVRVDRLPLAPGRYLVNLWLGRGHVPIDWLKECFVLSIEPGLLGVTEFVESRGYPVVIPSTWQFLDNA